LFDAVISYARELMTRFSARLILVHAHKPGADHVQEARRLRDYAYDWFPRQKVDTLATPGAASRVIQDVLRDQGADLIMIPMRSRGTLWRMLLGSEIDDVFQYTDAAVWTGANASLLYRAPRTKYQSILCAVDDTPETEHLLKSAAEIAKAYEARLSLLHVVCSPVDVGLEGPH
jgi:nucleotide-binding universal stress UspA family protein